MSGSCQSNNINHRPILLVAREEDSKEIAFLSFGYNAKQMLRKLKQQKKIR